MASNLFKPNNFTKLINLLLSTFISPSSSNLKDFYLELNKFNLVNPLLLDKPNDADKKQLESGSAIIQGVPHKVNNDFIQQCLQISSTLSISHQLASSLLQHAIQRCSRFQSTPIETSLILFYQDRLDLIRALQLILNGSNDITLKDSGLMDILNNFSNQVLDNNFISTIISELKALKNRTLQLANIDENITIQCNHFILLQRQELAHLLYLFALTRPLKQPDVTAILSYSATVDQDDPITPYLLSTILAAFNYDSQDINSLSTTFKSLQTADWANKPLRAVITLRYCLHIVSSFQSSPKLATAGSITEDDVEKAVLGAINQDAFLHLQHVLLNATESDAPLNQDFKPHLLYQYDTFITQFITTLSPILRKLKHREEDLVLASSRSRSFVDQPTSSRQDLAQLYFLIALLYRNTEPEAALKFWVADDDDYRLFAFLKWSAEARTPSMVYSLFEMIGSLASGTQCATYVYEFLSGNPEINDNNLCSWNSLFGALDFYATNLRNESAQSQKIGEIPPEEVNLLKAFLFVLKQVVGYSSVARASLIDNAMYKPIQTLFSLLTCSIPVDLKGSLFDTLSAFAAPISTSVVSQGSASLAAENARKIWSMLEQSQILPTLKAKHTSLQGLLFELEEIESPAGTYPISASFINFLNNLVHTPAKSLTLRKGMEVDSQTIPLGLGASHRTPGIQPFISFVVDDILLKLPHRGFKYLSERWKLTETSLCFVEKCLSTYDLSQLFVENTVNVGSVNEVIANPSDVSLCALVLHPGFNILTQFLSGGAILREIFNLVGTGIDALLDNRFKTPLYAKCIQRCLRIIYRVVSIQGMFLEVLLPLLAQHNNVIPGIGKVELPSSLNTLDQQLLFAHETIVQLALYVNAPDEETALLAVKIVAALAKSPFFNATDGFTNHYKRRMNRLTGIIDSSDESLRIMSGFVKLLEVDAPDSVSDEVDEEGVEGLLSDEAHDLHLSQASRSVVLDLLIENTKLSAPSPNIAHFLLGFNLHSTSPSEIEIEDPSNQSTKVSCLHVIFNLLGQGVNDEDDHPLFIRHPILAEKCYRLIYQLTISELTSNATLRYLRNHEDFFYRQLTALPIKQLPYNGSTQPLGWVKYGDGTVIQTTAATLASFLRFRGWLLDIVALELHALTNASQSQRVSRLVDVLFSDTHELDGLVENEFGEVVEMQEFDQSLIKILDIYQSLDLDYVDDETSSDMSVTFFSGIDLSTCLKTDEHGSIVYDFKSLLTLLGGYRRQLSKSGVIASPTQHEQVKGEIGEIMRFLSADNRRRQVHYARQFNLESWRRILDIILSKCFDAVGGDRRENVLLNIISTILPKLSSVDVSPATLELLSGVVLSLITKLRVTFTEFTNADTDERLYTMPNDRLGALLRQVLEILVKPGTTVIVRGNLYSVLHNYLQIVNIHSLSKAQLETDSQYLLESAFQQLVPIICRDCVDGSEVWKTVSFSVLDGLISLSSKNGSSTVLNIIAKHGFLRNFIQSIKNGEDVLINIIQNDPESLNPLYVFEAKMSSLLRIAQTSEGAEKLLDAQLFSILAQCEFVSCRPSGEETLMDYESFLPPAAERYHQLLLPTLQLASTVLSSVGSTSTVAAKEALGFAYAHREVFLEILRDNPALTSLALVREHHLIVCTLQQVQSAVSDDDLISPSGFGAFHTAILNLSTKYMTRANWVDRVVPFTDSEREDAQVISNGGNETSRFSIVASVAVESVNEWLLNYLTISRRTTTSFRPLLLPLFPQFKDGQDLHQASTSSPSLGQAITGLKELVSLFYGTVFDLKEHEFKLQQSPSMQTEVMLLSITKVLKSRLVRIQMMLVLIWRHAEFYINLNTKSNLSLSTSLKPYGNIDSYAIAREITHLISPTLTKIDNIELSSEMLRGYDVRSMQAFLQIICRRIREAMLNGQSERGGSGGDEEMNV
ncbi:hypothetical protein E3P99_03320 [Wallemia hederae]|uniref:Uncharacterized protein n=1 Tax=Wallemia hederae TaxID=1540922 RepID=A0A4T0FIN1_9BASI|nr:hypothetical protein E3P99_03320 [Wallemia hederae]